MRVISATDLARLSPYRDIIEALRAGFRAGANVPPRHHHQTSTATTLLLRPAWTDRFTGIKTVTVKSDNAALGFPVVQGSYLLNDFPMFIFHKY